MNNWLEFELVSVGKKLKFTCKNVVYFAQGDNQKKKRFLVNFDLPKNTFSPGTRFLEKCQKIFVETQFKNARKNGNRTQ